MRKMYARGHKVRLCWIANKRLISRGILGFEMGRILLLMRNHTFTIVCYEWAYLSLGFPWSKWRGSRGSKSVKVGPPSFIWLNLSMGVVCVCVEPPTRFLLMIKNSSSNSTYKELELCGLMMGILLMNLNLYVEFQQRKI
jgi:hypothetical protein